MPAATPERRQASTTRLSADWNSGAGSSSAGGRPSDAPRSLGPTNSPSIPSVRAMSKTWSTAAAVSIMGITRIVSLASSK